MNQQVPRLAIQKFANFEQGVKTHTLDLALLEQRHVGFGDADIRRQIFGPGLALRKHHVEFDDDGHGRWDLNELRVFFGQRHGLGHHGGDLPHHAGKQQGQQLVAAQGHRQ